MTTGIFRTYYDPQEQCRVKESAFVVNDVYEGPYMRFFNDGRKNLLCNYIHGKLEGHYIEWYYGGTVKEECYYVNHRKHGLRKCYYNDGYYRGTTIMLECDYVDGQLHGQRKEYYIDGVLKKESTYVMDKKHGLEIVHHPHTNSVSRFEYRNDEFYRVL